MKKKIPKFKTEAQERRFWQQHDSFDYIDWSEGEAVTLPNLKPTFFILLLFALGQIMRGNFQLFYNLVGANSLLFPLTDIIETFVFRSLIVNFNFSMGTAVSLYQSVFGFLLVMVSNWTVRRIEPDYALF